MKTSTLKEKRLNIRCGSQVRQLLDKAATYAHLSISEFVLTHALAAAEQKVQEHEAITLSAEDFHAFLTALDVPPPPNDALQRAFEHHATQVRG